MPESLSIPATDTDSDLLAVASAFDLVPFNPRGGLVREIRVERRHTDPEAWAIVSEGRVLGRDGAWYVEPMPSGRDQAFLDLTRWHDAQGAIAFVREHVARHPSGCAPEQMTGD